MSSPEVRPKLSVVVVCYAMSTQIKNTLQSLLPPYQRYISINEYEIIAHGEQGLESSCSEPCW